jgi:hypothetical protein
LSPKTIKSLKIPDYFRSHSVSPEDLSPVNGLSSMDGGGHVTTQASVEDVGISQVQEHEHSAFVSKLVGMDESAGEDVNASVKRRRFSWR